MNSSITYDTPRKAGPDALDVLTVEDYSTGYTGRHRADMTAPGEHDEAREQQAVDSWTLDGVEAGEAAALGTYYPWHPFVVVDAVEDYRPEHGS